jgi:hypothetical protein
MGRFPAPLLLARAQRIGQRSSPSNLIGANGFAEQDHCSRVCGAEHRRDEVAPLTVILSGKRMFGTVGRVTRTDPLRAVPETCVTASNHRLREAGTSARRRPPHPSALPRERARLSRRPGRGPSPGPFSAEAQPVLTLALPHASLSPALRVVSSRSFVRAWPAARRAEGAPLKPWRKLSQPPVDTG